MKVVSDFLRTYFLAMSNAKEFSSVSRHLKVRSYQRKNGVIGSVIGVFYQLKSILISGEIGYTPSSIEPADSVID